MKFENPIINISMFNVENVVTTASGGSEQPQSNFDAALKSVTDNTRYQAVLEIKF